MKKLLAIPAAFCLTAMDASAATLTFESLTEVSQNNANYDLSVFPGQAAYNNRGAGGVEPGAPTFRTTLGDGTLLSYNLVGNDGSGSPLTAYASGGTRTPTPVAPAANVQGSGEDWANVWTTTDPGAGLVFSGTKNHNPTGVAGAANTFARAAEVDGTIDISGLASGQIYIPDGARLSGVLGDRRDPIPEERALNPRPAAGSRDSIQHPPIDPSGSRDLCLHRYHFL